MAEGLPRSVYRARRVMVVTSFTFSILMGYPVLAQDAASQRSQGPTATTMPDPASTKSGSTMQKLSGVWIEGPGFEITYGANYATCSQRCLANAKCAMIEYYRPEKKCNLYDAVRPQLKGGSSDVAIRR